MKNLNNMKPLGVKEDSIMKLLQLYEFKGKSKHYDEAYKADKEAMIRDTVKKELLYFSEFYKLNITDARKKVLAKKDCEAKNKDEQFYINFKNVLARMLKDPDDIELRDYQYLELVEALYNKADTVAFRTYKVVDENESLISRTRIVSLREELKQMLEEFEFKLNHKDYEISNMITNFYVDYKNQEIFTKYNNEIGYIILFSLILKSGFTVFKYVTFFDKLIKYKDKLEDATLAASLHYSEGYSDTRKLNEIIIDILLDSYHEIEDNLNSYTFEYKNTKEDLIMGIILKLPQEFTRDDIKQKEPLISDSTINRALAKLSKENKIRALGTGRSAKWLKLQSDINFMNSKQIDIFNLSDD